MRSSQGAADEVTVLLQRARQHSEMHLPILVDSYYPDHRLAIAVPGHQHRTRTNLRGIAGIAQRRPAEPLIVFSVEVGYQVDLRVHHVSSIPSLRVVVRIGHDPAIAARERFHTAVEIIKADRIVARIPPSRL